MLSLQQTITCLIALLPIRLSICGDPLIWASVEAQAEYKTNPDGGPGSECSSPSTFQMRADGSWIPASEFDLTGNFDEGCGIYIHLSIPESEPEGGDELRSKTLELLKEKIELEKEEEKLSKERKEHEAKMETLRNEKERLDKTKEKQNAKENEIKTENEKTVILIEKRNSLAEKIKVLGGADLDSVIEIFKEKETKINQSTHDAKEKEIFFNKYLNGICSRIPISLYLRITGIVEVPEGTEAYICHAKGPNYSNVIEEMWNSETEKIVEKKKAIKDELYTLESQELQLKNEKKIHEDNMIKLKNEKDAVHKNEMNLKTTMSSLETERAKKKDIDARRNEVEEKKKNLGKYVDEDFAKEAENKQSEEKKRVEKEIELQKKLLDLYETNECDPISDSDFIIIKNEMNYHIQDIMVCEPK